ncbi:MAG: hypothetical protein EAZ68_12305, partial [Oscillatoriales cyanobacterium]
SNKSSFCRGSGWCVPTLLIHDFVGVSGIRATTGGLPLQENETALGGRGGWGCEGDLDLA